MRGAVQAWLVDVVCFTGCLTGVVTRTVTTGLTSSTLPCTSSTARSRCVPALGCDQCKRPPAWCGNDETARHPLQVPLGPVGGLGLDPVQLVGDLLDPADNSGGAP